MRFWLLVLFVFLFVSNSSFALGIFELRIEGHGGYQMQSDTSGIGVFAGPETRDSDSTKGSSSSMFYGGSCEFGLGFIGVRARFDKYADTSDEVIPIILPVENSPS